MATKGWRNKAYQERVLSMVKPGVELICFDTETTGLSSTNDRIIEIGAMKFRVRDDYLLDTIEELHLYINPGFLISDKIVELTHITNEHLMNYPFEEDSFERVVAFFGDSPILCGHNVDFDIRFLSAMYSRNGYTLQHTNLEIDTLEMSRDIFCNGEVNNHKLGTLAAYCGLDAGVQFHSAIEDVRVTAKLFQLLVIEYASRAAENTLTTPLHKPTVFSIKFWEGYRGFSRIYVETSAGSLYYDVRRKVWSPKDVSIDTIDVAYVEKECLRGTNCVNIEEFSKFKGRIYLK